jgi:hypothetical protein
MLPEPLSPPPGRLNLALETLNSPGFVLRGVVVFTFCLGLLPSACSIWDCHVEAVREPNGEPVRKQELGCRIVLHLAAINAKSLQEDRKAL